MAGKPKVHIDQDGDGDTDVSVDVDVPEPTPGDGWPDGARETLTDLVARMEVVPPVGTTRISYQGAREALRSLLTNTP